MKRKPASVNRTYGLTNAEITALSTYNSEVARGLVHTESYKLRMKDLQRRYNTNYAVESNSTMNTIIACRKGRQ